MPTPGNRLALAPEECWIEIVSNAIPSCLSETTSCSAFRSIQGLYGPSSLGVAPAVVRQISWCILLPHRIREQVLFAPRTDVKRCRHQEYGDAHCSDCGDKLSPGAFAQGDRGQQMHQSKSGNQAEGENKRRG